MCNVASKKQTMQDSTPPPLSWLQENLLQELLYWKFKKDNVVLQHQLLEPIQILSKVLHILENDFNSFAKMLSNAFNL